MKKYRITALLITVSTLFVFLSITSVRADPPLAEGLIPSRICEIEEKLTIVAGPDMNASGTALADMFPEKVPCDSETGYCSKWNYRFIWTGNPSLVYLNMSSSLALFGVKAKNVQGVEVDSGNYYPAGVGEPGGFGENVYDDITMRWSAHSNTFDTSIITESALPGVATAGGKRGGFKGFCLIQGAADKAVEEGFAQDTIVTQKIIESEDGSTLCTITDPVTECDIGVVCGTNDPLPFTPLTELVSVNIGEAVVNFSVPGQRCPTGVFDNGLPNTRYYCSGGRCYAY